MTFLTEGSGLVVLSYKFVPFSDSFRDFSVVKHTTKIQWIFFSINKVMIL